MKSATRIVKVYTCMSMPKISNLIYICTSDFIKTYTKMTNMYIYQYMVKLLKNIKLYVNEELLKYHTF